MTYKNRYRGDKNQHEHNAKESKKNSALTRSISFSVCIYFTVALVCTCQPVHFKKIGICKPIYLFRLVYLPPFAISSLDLPWDPPLVYKPTKHATQFFLLPTMPPTKEALSASDGKWSLYIDKEDSFSPPPEHKRPFVLHSISPIILTAYLKQDALKLKLKPDPMPNPSLLCP